MKFESFPSPKSDKELDSQVKQASKNLETELVHESMQDDLGLLSINELKGKYKVRYDTYLANLRAEKRGEQLEQKDLKKAQVLITAFNNLDNYIQQQASGENKILRGRQVPVFNEIRNALERGVTKGYVKLPTGVGKTVLFSQLIEALDLKALIGVPSLPLVKQTSDKMEKFTTKSYGTYSGEGKDTTKDITTITYQSLISAVRDGIIKSEDFPVFVLDEAHKALGPETSKAVKAMEDSLQIGFTATPNYSTEHSVSKVLPEEIYTMELREAIEEGLINRTKTIHAFTNVDLSSVPVVNGDYDSKQLEKVINVHGRNMAALELYKNKFSDLKAIVNCSGVQHAKDVARIFAEQGIKAAHIDGSMNEDQRNDILEKLATGELMVVTNARLLLEGFDEPTVSVALNLNPTLSLVDAEQRGGRVARLDDDNPEKWAYVIDFIDKNSKKKQVLFSEILGGDVVIPEAVDEKNNVVPMSPKERESRSRTPIHVEDLEIDGLRVVVDSQEIMEVTKENQESRDNNTLDKKPGWDTANNLKNILKADPSNIKKSAEKYRTEHPEWFEMQKSMARFSEHYSPELIELLKNEFNQILDKKEGWCTASSLMSLLKANHLNIKKSAEKYRTEHPEWFEMQRTGVRDAEHYSPSLVALLKNEFLINNDKKIGWENSKTLSKIIKSDSNTIKKNAEKYRTEHPEWFEMQKSGKHTVEYYSPELIELLTNNRIISFAHKPGWESASYLSKNFKIGHGKFISFAEKYRTEHPEWFEMQKRGANTTQHYSPELIEQIKKDLGK